MVRTFIGHHKKKSRRLFEGTLSLSLSNTHQNSQYHRRTLSLSLYLSLTHTPKLTNSHTITRAHSLLLSLSLSLSHFIADLFCKQEHSHFSHTPFCSLLHSPFFTLKSVHTPTHTHTLTHTPSHTRTHTHFIPLQHSWICSLTHTGTLSQVNTCPCKHIHSLCAPSLPLSFALSEALFNNSISLGKASHLAFERWR